MTNQDIYDLRSALEFIDKMGELVRVEREVNPELELTSIIYATFCQGPHPALRFTKLKGHKEASACSLLAGTRERMAKLMGFPTDPRGFKEQYLKALANPIAPVTVDTGPCKENVILAGENDFDITKIIPPVVGAKGSTRSYFQPLVVTRHPVTGERNVGMYRSCIQGPNKVTVNLRVENQGGMNLEAAMARQEPFPVALVIGVDPSIYVGCIAKLPYGHDEFAHASALKGRPIDLVRCETIELMVPAHAEVVIEGMVRPPYTRGDDGPWPEYLGYLSMVIHPPIMDITAVTFRDHPINYVILPTTENANLRVGLEVRFFKMLREFAADFVVDTCFSPESCGHHAFVKVKKSNRLHEGLQISLALAAFNIFPYLDLVVLVDEDVDIYDYRQIDWAICTRCNPTNQVHILPEGRSHTNVPIVGVRDLTDGKATRGKMIIDATIPWEFRIKEKAPGINYFARSEYLDIHLKDYFPEKDWERWGVK